MNFIEKKFIPRRTFIRGAVSFWVCQSWTQ